MIVQRKIVACFLLVFSNIILFMGTVTAQSGKIAFHTNQDGNLEIYVINADGT